jgi:hypothetical protein
MEVERFLAVHRNKAPRYEELDCIPLAITVDDIVNAGIKPKEESDYFYYDPLELTEEQVMKIEPFLTKKIDFNFNYCFYVLICLSV